MYCTHTLSYFASAATWGGSTIISLMWQKRKTAILLKALLAVKGQVKDPGGLYDFQAHIPRTTLPGLLSTITKTLLDVDSALGHQQAGQRAGSEQWSFFIPPLASFDERNQGRERWRTGSWVPVCPSPLPSRPNTFTIADHLLYTSWLDSTDLLYELGWGKTIPI